MTKHQIIRFVAFALAAACTDSGVLPTESVRLSEFSGSAIPVEVACGSSDLIAAIEEANLLAEAPTTLNLSPGCVYTITQPHSISPDLGINGLPVIRVSLGIKGNGATIERVPGADFRLFYVLNEVDPAAPEQGRGNLSLNGVTLRGGSQSNSGGALFVRGGTVFITNALIEGSHSGDDGGGVFNRGGSLTIRNSVVSGNSASDKGGGVHTDLGTTTIENSTIEGNTASDDGGGVYNNAGTLVIAGTRIAGNAAADNGGGLSNIGGSVSISTNSEIEGNEAGDSGGLYNEGGTLVVSDSRIVDNTAKDDGGGLQNVVGGTLHIRNSVISGNRADDTGGGISNMGLELTVVGGTFTSNHASSGGAVANEGADLTIEHSDFSFNDAIGGGGAIFHNGGDVTIVASTFTANIGKAGGAIAAGSVNPLVQGTLTLTNSTLSNNTAREGGGGVFAEKGLNLVIQFTTITGNTAQQKTGGGLLLSNELGAETRIRGTILAGNFNDDVAALERKSTVCCSEGYNLIGTAGGIYISLADDFGQVGDQRGVTDPRLGALAANGGPTRTHAPLPGSPVIGAGGSSCPATDQRGVSRAAPCTIGAFQLSSTSPAPQSITFPAPPSPQAFGVTFTVAPSASSGMPVTLTTSGACTAIGYAVTMTSAAGTCTLTASQSGSADFEPAAPVVHDIAATKAAQTIQFTSTPPSPLLTGDTYLPVAIGGGSGNPVMLGALGECTYSSSTGRVTMTAEGNCTVTASQAGSESYFDAPEARQELTVGALTEIRFRSHSGAQNGTSSTLTITRPSGVSAGDFLLAQITFDKGTDAGSNALITPAGWTLVRRTDLSSDVGQAIFYRVADGSESTGSFTWTFAQSVSAVGGIMRYTGVYAANPIVASSGATGVSSELTAPGVATHPSGNLVAFYAFKKTGVALIAPTEMAARYGLENAGTLTIGAADERRTTWPASSGSRTATAQIPGSTSPPSDKWVAQLVMLRPR